MALHFIQELRRLGNFRPVEPGVVRHQLLQYRLIMDVGVSLATADVIFDTLQANLLLTGKVLDYQDGRGETGIPTVDFSAMILDKEKHTIVLASDSYNTGDDRVHFFDFGRINTACGVATEMVRGIVGRIGPPRQATEPADYTSPRIVEIGSFGDIVHRYSVWFHLSGGQRFENRISSTSVRNESCRNSR